MTRWPLGRVVRSLRHGHSQTGRRKIRSSGTPFTEQPRCDGLGPLQMVPFQPRVVGQNFAGSQPQRRHSQRPVLGIVREQDRRQADAVAAKQAFHLVRVFEPHLKVPPRWLQPADLRAHRTGERVVAGAEAHDDRLRMLSQKTEQPLLQPGLHREESSLDSAPLPAVTAL